MKKERKEIIYIEQPNNYNTINSNNNNNNNFNNNNYNNNNTIEWLD